MKWLNDHPLNKYLFANSCYYLLWNISTFCLWLLRENMSAIFYSDILLLKCDFESLSSELSKHPENKFLRYNMDCIYMINLFLLNLLYISIRSNILFRTSYEAPFYVYWYWLSNVWYAHTLAVWCWLCVW